MLMGKRPHLSVLDTNDEILESLKQQLEKENISCSVIAGYVDLTSAHAAEVPYMEFQISYVESLSKIAFKTGCTSRSCFYRL